jgi:hypothetical protein
MGDEGPNSVKDALESATPDFSPKTIHGVWQDASSLLRELR